MKRNSIVIGFCASVVCIVVACKDHPNPEEKYCTLIGVIGVMPMPPTTTPPLPGLLFCLETDFENYILTFDSYSIPATETSFVISNIEYFVEDRVEIVGKINEEQLVKQYKYLDIKAIRRIPRLLENPLRVAPVRQVEVAP